MRQFLGKECAHSGQPPDIVVFPESFCSSMGPVNLQNNPILAAVAEVVAEFGVMCVFGTLVKKKRINVCVCSYNPRNETAERKMCDESLADLKNFFFCQNERSFSFV